MNTREIAAWMLANCIVIDTETTGIGTDAAVVEFAAVDGETGAVLVDSLVHTSATIEPGAAAVNNITPGMLMFKPKIAELLTQVMKAHGGRRELCAYNASFDDRLLQQSIKRDLQEMAVPVSYNSPTVWVQHDAMELANRHFAKDHASWDADRSCFRRMSLRRCCEIAGVDFKGAAHRALSDAIATRDLLKVIAEGRV